MGKDLNDLIITPFHKQKYTPKKTNNEERERSTLYKDTPSLMKLMNEPFMSTPSKTCTCMFRR